MNLSSLQEGYYLCFVVNIYFLKRKVAVRKFRVRERNIMMVENVTKQIFFSRSHVLAKNHRGPFEETTFRVLRLLIGDLVSKETVCCVGGKVRR